MQRSAPFRHAAVVTRCGLWVVAAIFAVATLRPLIRPYAYSDFATFYVAARCFAEGRDPYDHSTLQEVGKRDFGGWIGRYLYPPPFAATIIRPLTSLRFEVARRIWVCLEAAAFLLACFLLAHAPRSPPDARRQERTVVALLALPFAPMHFDLHLGSVSGLLLLGCALFLWARDRRPRLAATALAAACILKLVPAFGLVPNLVRGSLRRVMQVVIAAVAGVVVTLPWTGFDTYATYVREVAPQLARGNFSWFTNQSVDALFTRLLLANPDTTPWTVSPQLHRIVTLAISAGLVAGLVAIVWRNRAARSSPDRDGWEFAFALLTGLLVSRVTWEYMVVLALPCFVLWAREAVRARLGVRAIGLLVLAYALCALPFPYAETPIRSGPGLLLASPRLAGMLILWGLSLRRLAGATSNARA